MRILRQGVNENRSMSSICSWMQLAGRQWCVLEFDGLHFVRVVVVMGFRTPEAVEVAIWCGFLFLFQLLRNLLWNRSKQHHHKKNHIQSIKMMTFFYGRGWSIDDVSMLPEVCILARVPHLYTKHSTRHGYLGNSFVFKERKWKGSSPKVGSIRSLY